MQKFVTLLLVVALLVGCTSQQVQQAEADLVKVLQAADDAVVKYAEDPKTLDKAEAGLSALAAVAPQTGPIHDAIVAAQAALLSVKNNQGTVAGVQLALDTLIGLLEKQNQIPVGAVRHKKSLTKPK